MELAGIFAGMALGIFIANSWIILYFMRQVRDSKEEVLRFKEKYDIG